MSPSTKRYSHGLMRGQPFLRMVPSMMSWVAANRSVANAARSGAAVSNSAQVAMAAKVAGGRRYEPRRRRYRHRGDVVARPGPGGGDRHRRPGGRSGAGGPSVGRAPSTTDAPPPPRPLPAPAARRPGPIGSGPALPLRPDGFGQVLPTPPELVDRRLPTIDLLPPPADGPFASTVAAVPHDVVARSSWEPACPVTLDELRYVTVSFWGFDDRAHTGELSSTPPSPTPSPACSTGSSTPGSPSRRCG